MELGAFSVSLSVKDLAASMQFYEKLGFSAPSPDLSQGWLIMKNGDHIIGLFENMFEGNILTFNPGWNQSAENLESFTDVRQLQQELKASGITLNTEVDETSSGPASITLQDPDGNQILIDQHR